MEISGGLFNVSLRKLLQQMSSDTDVIQMAVAKKLLSQYLPKYGRDRAMTVAAAVSNRLFAKISPKHNADDLKLADDLAANILSTDDEVRYAALMSCRARLLFEADGNSEKTWHIWDHIQWMATIWNLPKDEANPNSIRQLAIVLHKKYL